MCATLSVPRGTCQRRRLVRLDKIRATVDIARVFLPVGCVDPEIHGQGVAVHSIVRPEGWVDCRWRLASAVASRGSSMSTSASCPGLTLRSLQLSSFAGSLSCRHPTSANGARRCTFQQGFGSRPPVDVSRRAISARSCGKSSGLPLGKLGKLV